MTPLLYAPQFADAALPGNPLEEFDAGGFVILIAVIALILTVLAITAAAVVVLIIVLKRLNAPKPTAAQPPEHPQEPHS